MTDLNTGLIWEKLDDNNSGGTHDKDDLYNWADAFAVKIAALNTPPCFANHCDWRLPNLKELQSIVNYETVQPAVSLAFNTSCAPGCTVSTCSCTFGGPYPNDYWSSTTSIWLAPGYPRFGGNGLGSDFEPGGWGYGSKVIPQRVRAVRAGL